MAKVRLGGWPACTIALAVVFGLLLPGRAGATLRFGDSLELSGDISAQNLFRMRTVGQFQPVQQRNTLRLRVDYSLIKGDQMLQKFAAPEWIESMKLYMLYRGVYDSVFDWAPGGRLYDFNGKPIVPPSTLSAISASTRNALKYENDMREAYIDINFKDIPLSLRLGKQQIVWGETDNFRLLDRVNALDLTWHLQQETEIGHGWD